MPDHPPASLRARVEETLRSPVLPCLDPDDAVGWNDLAAGSLQGRMGCLAQEGAHVLRVELSVRDLPSDRELILPLMHELLTRNYRAQGLGTLGLHHDRVVLAWSCPLAELQMEAVLTALTRLHQQAEDLAQTLRGRYGGTTRQRTPIDPGLWREDAPAPAPDLPPRAPPPGEKAWENIGLFSLFDRTPKG